jgi:hypothetical protein
MRRVGLRGRVRRGGIRLPVAARGEDRTTGSARAGVSGLTLSPILASTDPAGDGNPIQAFDLQRSGAAQESGSARSPGLAQLLERVQKQHRSFIARPVKSQLRVRSRVFEPHRARRRAGRHLIPSFHPDPPPLRGGEGASVLTHTASSKVTAAQLSRAALLYVRQNSAVSSIAVRAQSALTSRLRSSGCWAGWRWAGSALSSGR